MLHLFRKYQKVIFVFVTVVVVISFVFFGTYQAFAPSMGSKEKQTTAYVTKSGKKVGSYYFDHLCQFLTTEGAGRDFFEGNYLSDYLISREFLETGLALDLIAQDPENYREELDERVAKERGYTPYVHPIAKQISAASVWELFAPDMMDGLKALQSAECGISSVEARVKLYNAQRRFPPQFLANMLRYQERDAKSLMPDPKLARGEIALFNYKNLEDWFGPTFVKRVAQVVIETVAIAKEKGYKVSTEEAYSDLLYKSHKTYEALKEQMEMPVAMDGEKLMQLYFRQLGYDEKVFVQVYRDLMLFKRYLHDAAESVVLDPTAFEAFYAHAGEAVTVELTQMPKALRFQTREQLDAFESYLVALGGNASHLLGLPEEIKPRPELTGNRYEVFLGCVDKKSLEGKVTVKRTWNWEEKNFDKLRAKFPYLGEGSPMTVLDALDKKRRASIDAFARQQILADHPEWIDEAVRNVNIDYHDLFIADKGAKLDLKGIDDVAALKVALDGQDEVLGYTQDQTHFYRMVVQERHADQILTFEQAKKLGVLESVQSNVKSRVDQILAQVQSDLKVEDPIPYRFHHQLISGEETLEQFAPVKELVTWTRSEEAPIAFDAIEEFGQGASPQTGAFTYKVVERTTDKTMPMDKILKGNELLSTEVRTSVLREILEKCDA